MFTATPTSSVFIFALKHEHCVTPLIYHLGFHQGAAEKPKTKCANSVRGLLSQLSQASLL